MNLDVSRRSLLGLSLATFGGAAAAQGSAVTKAAAQTLNRSPLYTPVIPETPNGTTIVPRPGPGGVKHVTLNAEEVRQEVLNANGKRVVALAWGYNGGSPGPTLVFYEGDEAAITIVNRLPEPTSVHWHGVIVPNSMDGVPEIGQPTPKIGPGESFTYRFRVRQVGTHMYHSHLDTSKQDLLGMVGGLIFLPRRESNDLRVDRDLAYLLHEWTIPQIVKPEDITMMPRTGSPTDTVNSVEAMPIWTNPNFNFLTMNGKSYPSTERIHVRLGDRIRVRFYNVAMNAHPMHFHGQDFYHIEEDGNPIEPMKINTLTVAPGKTQSILIEAVNPGIWPLHCHLAHHVANNMSSGFGGMAAVFNIVARPGHER